jgi:hypothetical protein
VRLLTSVEASQSLGVSRATVLNYARAKKLPVRGKKGKGFLFAENDIMQLRHELDRKGRRVSNPSMARQNDHLSLVERPRKGYSLRDLLLYVGAYQTITGGRSPSLRISAESLGVSPPTIRKWLNMLKAQHLIYMPERPEKGGTSPGEIEITPEGEQIIANIRRRYWSDPPTEESLLLAPIAPPPPLDG